MFVQRSRNARALVGRSLHTTPTPHSPTTTPSSQSPYTSVLSRAGPLYEQEPAVASRLIASSRTKNLVPIKTNIRGTELLNTPRLNKGAAFTREERAIFGLEGMIPYEIHDLTKQVARAYHQLQKQPTVILKHAFLASMRDQNQVLFYRLMQDHLKELLGILYTPGAAEAVMGYSYLFRRPLGCFISFPNQDGMRAQLEAHVESLEKQADLTALAERADSSSLIDLIVVTDSEAVLGIGDQGVGGITISLSKAALYTLGAGIQPNRILPVVLDPGTDNHIQFSDPLYLGWKRGRVRGKLYDKFVDKFIQHCRELFPNALIHFEDFGLQNAQRLLDKYKDVIPCFNDDIEGTGAVALAALLSAVGVTKSKLSEQRIVVYGAGSAGMGIADQIRDGMMLLEGITKEEANKRFWCIDRNGLLVESMGNSLRHAQLSYARPDEECVGWDTENPDQKGYYLQDVIHNVKPTILIGTSTHARAFTEDIVKEMAKHVERPIIFPLSNPTALAECDPSDANTWTEGRALLATGSPFPPCEYNGKTYIPAQNNNALIYPGLGLGTILSRARTISPGMFMAGIQALANLAPALHDPNASLLPDLAEVREVSVHVAAAIVRQACKEGRTRDETVLKVVNGQLGEGLEEFIRGSMWDPVYRPLELID
ncbi:hypothetical protein FFLO_01229 [Filobasidium floriforme]|uniref:Malic enzyme n=1 Tax=Filobasidium floriforme TaxID=5210 RepID=A0A8K0JQA4_9TREE|nr:putative malate dehydrogenase [Filobasidium floriforme]KAG7566970.1 hypothetical protein FFLO_01229 [Filobasidium floriforme]KAH8083628.1 putative malate dehydrogenase [Filobasidium floriforme]